MTKNPIWTPNPESVQHTKMFQFMTQNGFQSYSDLYQWSIEDPISFWSSFWEYSGLIGSRGSKIFTPGDTFYTSRWFEDSTLNYAENLLRSRPSDTPVVHFWAEDQRKKTLTYQELYDQTSLWAQAFQSLGLETGDRVAAFMPNMPETLCALLGASSFGATWSSCSPDFGAPGIIDRFGQIAPKVLIAVDGYLYNGKVHDCLSKLPEIIDGIPSLEKIIIVPYFGSISESGDLSTDWDPEKMVLWETLHQEFKPKTVTFTPLPFNHPLFIMFSSGTTGVPKCITHGTGGTLLQHMKEHQLHCDLRLQDSLFYFTTCGWMMWNWQMSALASGATLMMYEGSPFYPDGTILWRFAEAHNCTHFGGSAKYLDACHKGGVTPKSYDLLALRMIASTGSPLSPETYDYVYQEIKKDVCLSSISGGTDIISCFALGNPILPVYRGELQCRGLGLAVEVWNDDGHPVVGEKGELVCTHPFPCQPIGFWGDPQNQKYHAAYFDHFPNIWCHGDFVEITPEGGLIIYGRSDAVLNPGGVRIGTAEIYRQVEQLDEVLESIAVGQEWDNDIRVVLFVKLKDGIQLGDALKGEIKSQIRTHCTPRHVPAKIIQVPDIPRTKSGKIVELAVREVIHNRPVKNQTALLNPEALGYFKDLSELQG